ncbi:hypothetical protein PIB30_048208 [Stylosanthes scabra]|uniref:Uncharacterized protein n=1 Tax=Stylosanthes scabra TaxID=79078 RepID=A0ABU6SGR5_9FABA|nr:hypothetical protein [Stylosanthes scabra]
MMSTTRVAFSVAVVLRFGPIDRSEPVQCENNPSMERVTLESLASAIKQLRLEVQSLIQLLKNKHNSPFSVFKVFGSDSTNPNVQDIVPNNQLLQCSLEKARTDLSIAKNGLTNPITPIDLPGLELLSWVPVYFKPKASMRLDHNELAIAAYLYGVPLMHNDEEDIVLSSAITVQRDVFRSLLPGKPIYDEVLILVADMMTKELTTKSGYWFLPPSFAATYLEKALDHCRFYDYQNTPYFSTVGYEFVEPKGLPTLKDGSNDAVLWVATWMITCVEESNFNIKVDEEYRMKIAVSLVLKDQNIYNENIKTRAIENLQIKYDIHDRDREDIYRN